MQRAYNFAIFYFILFSILLLISSTVLFSSKIGFTTEDVLTYYLGNEALFIAPKTSSGVLKIVLPHIFAFGLFTMVVLHFLLFIKKNKTKEIQFLIYLVFLSAFLELFSPFFILWGFHFFTYIKIVSFFLFEGAILYTLFLFFKSIFFH